MATFPFSVCKEVCGSGDGDGYTPQKGVDYWTEEDKAEIAAEVEPFYATYGTTTVQELTDAYNSGRAIFLNYNNGYQNRILNLTGYDNAGVFYFGTVGDLQGNATDDTVTLQPRLIEAVLLPMNITGLWFVEECGVASKEYVIDYVTAQIGEVLGGES